MSDNSRIEWTDATWGPIKARRKDTGKVGWHCERVSDGCKHCYSATFNGRMLPNGGTGLHYTRQSREKVDIFIDEQTLTQPLRWKKPRKVFVCSMTDLFAEFVPFDFIDRVFAVMALCPQHTFQVLTKRPERMAEYTASCPTFDLVRQAVAQILRDVGVGEAEAAIDDVSVRGWPLPNVWLGTSVENQEQADARIPHLLRCPAAVRFLSAEPLLGAVDLSAFFGGAYATIMGSEPNYNFGIDWVIVGGESGPGARPCNVEWIRSIVRQCKAAGVSVFCKQLGSDPVSTFDEWNDGNRTAGNLVGDLMHWKLTDRKGGDPSEWPEDLRVREMPQIGGGA